jgi:hypothetical protein
MVWPARLAPLYPSLGATLPVWRFVFSALALVSITLLIFAFRKQRYLAVGWLWFLGTLIPVIGLVQVGDAAMADRYAYIPLIGIFLMIAWGLNDLADARRVSSLWRVIPALCTVAILSIVTENQLSY